MVKASVDELGDEESWRHTFGDPDSPVVIAALDSNTLRLCELLRSICAGEGRSFFVTGPTGAGKSLLVSALIAEAEERGVQVHVLTPSSDPQRVLRDLGRGDVQLLAVDRFDQLTQGVRTSVIENRRRASAGLFATAEQLGAATESVLIESLDMVEQLPPLEERPADVVAITQLLWPNVCGSESDLIGHCDQEAVESLCRGPHPEAVTSLRDALINLANTLITSGSLNEGRILRPIGSQDIGEALLAAMRSRPVVRAMTTNAAVIVAEGTTDVAYLSAAAELAAASWGWDLLSGCELRPAGADRSGGAEAVWLRLVELRASSVDCVGLLDNDKNGRRSYRQAGSQSLTAEVLPKDFDRLRLDDEERAVEMEDLLSLRVIDAFYAEHPGLAPEDVRWRNGAWRIVPRGSDKDVITAWIAAHMRLEDCERIIYLICVLRGRLGMPVPRDDLDAWRRSLTSVDESSPQAILASIVSGSAGPPG